jgi:hypothetical protein
MTVDVIAGLGSAANVTEARAVGLPPTSRDSAGRTGVVPVHRAAELRVALAAQVVAVALLTAAGADRGVCRAWLKNVAHRGHGEGRTDDSGPPEQAPSAHACPYPAADGIDEFRAHEDASAVRYASWGRSVSMTINSHTPSATKPT